MYVMELDLYGSKKLIRQDEAYPIELLEQFAMNPTLSIPNVSKLTNISTSSEYKFEEKKRRL